MLEIICLIFLWRANGKIAKQKGLRTTKYHVLTVVLWFTFEFIGMAAAYVIAKMLQPDSQPFFIIIYIGLLAAALGGYTSNRIVKKAEPAENFSEPREDKPTFWNMQLHQSVELLSSPTTVKIIVEPSLAQTQKPEIFFLNCRPLCTLYPGNEYTFRTMHKKNQVTINLPQYPNETSENTVKFVGAENGYVEIHASEGKLLRYMFQNYTSE